MTSDPFARSRLRKVLAAVILVTIPCYCAGLLAILFAPGRYEDTPVTPSPTSSSTAVVFASQTLTTFTASPQFSTLTPSQTPILTSTGTITNTPTITPTPTTSTTPTPSNTPFQPPPTFTNTPIPSPTHTSPPTLTSTPTPTLEPSLTPSPTTTIGVPGPTP